MPASMAPVFMIIPKEPPTTRIKAQIPTAEAGTVPCHQSSEHIVEKPKPPKSSSPHTFCRLMKLLAGIIDGFAVLSVQHIICQPQFIQILLGPLRRTCFKKRIQLWWGQHRRDPISASSPLMAVRLSFTASRPRRYSSGTCPPSARSWSLPHRWNPYILPCGCLNFPAGT